VYAALLASNNELAGIADEDRAVVRPWLQAFTATWVSGHITYGGDEIREQIQAVYDAGYEEWILWNASNRYTDEGLEKAE
ncbi:MAG: putative glycoside hydrolase, partial [Lachnospiraceae bacterium]|nr:putative glycoside hydrolase [Lachnospiraceae bacterium]